MGLDQRVMLVEVGGVPVKRAKPSWTQPELCASKPVRWLMPLHTPKFGVPGSARLASFWQAEGHQWLVAAALLLPAGSSPAARAYADGQIVIDPVYWVVVLDFGIIIKLHLES